MLLDGGCGEVVVVLGAGAAEARLLLAGPGGDRVRVVEARRWSDGLSSSLAAGLTAVASDPQRSALVHLVDLPDVGAAVVQRVLTRAGASADLLARATYHGRPGHPVLIGQMHLTPLLDHLASLDTTTADEGARGYLARFPVVGVECGDLAGGQDSDLLDGESVGLMVEPVRSTEGRTDGEQRG